MSQNQPGHGFDVVQAMKKLVVSACVIGTFVLYVVYERHVGSGDILVVAPTEIAMQDDSAQMATSVSPTATFMVPTPTTLPGPTVTPSIPPTNTALANDADIANRSNATVVPPTDTDVPPTDTPLPTDTPIPPTDIPTLPPANSNKYRDGLYKGDVANAFYGNVQVQIRITSGKIAVVQFLDYPHDRRTSQFINSQAMPYLKTEAIRAQSAEVDIISGATLTSQAFIESLQSALNKAKI